MILYQLKTYKFVDQYLFHTATALQSLRFVEATTIEP